MVVTNTAFALRNFKLAEPAATTIWSAPILLYWVNVDAVARQVEIVCGRVAANSFAP